MSSANEPRSSCQVVATVAMALMPTSAASRSDAPALVLMPGIDGTAVFLRPLAALLAQHASVRIVELPSASANTYDVLSESVRAATRDIRRMVVVGYSFSGPLAIRLARRDPARVVGVVLMATFLSAPQAVLLRWPLLSRTPIVWLLRAARRLPRWLRARRDDPLRVAKSETWRLTHAGTVARRLRQIVALDARDDLRACSQPVLAISFDADEAVPPVHAARIAEAHHGVQAVQLTGTHLTPFTTPEPVAATILDFWQQLSDERLSTDSHTA